MRYTKRMLVLGVFLIELVALFLLSQSLTRSLSKWFYQVFRHQAVVIQLLSILFLPGVILHELSHLLTASMLFVPTGEIEFLPEIHGDEVKMGSVSIAQTDPFRRFLIGVAPLIFGLGVLFLLFWYFLPTLTLVSWQTAVLLYAVFEISNTMFSSRKDMEGAIGLLGLCLVFVVLLFVLRVNVWGVFQQWVENAFALSLFTSMSWYLGIAVITDVIAVGITQGLLKLHRPY